MVTATPLSGEPSFVGSALVPTFVGVGDISAADPEDWYSITAAINDQLFVQTISDPIPNPGGLPIAGPSVPTEVYDPDGVKRAPVPTAIQGFGEAFTVDKPGNWRIRVATDIAPLPHFEGNYGLSIVRRTDHRRQHPGAGRSASRSIRTHRPIRFR